MLMNLRKIPLLTGTKTILTEFDDFISMVLYGYTFTVDISTYIRGLTTPLPQMNAHYRCMSQQIDENLFYLLNLITVFASIFTGIR